MMTRDAVNGIIPLDTRGGSTRRGEKNVKGSMLKYTVDD